MPGINILAVIAAAVAMFAIGALWYSPFLFGKAWMRANGFADVDLQRGNIGLIFGLAALFTLIIAADLAFFLAAPEVTLAFALGASLAAGLGFAALSLGIVALFERRSWTYILVNGGYLTVGFLAMGLILGLWR